MSLQFDGKVIIVTGGARGIGRVYSRELAKAGTRVVVSEASDFITGQTLLVDGGSFMH